MTPETSAPFGPLKQIDAGLLSVGYAEAGPADGPAAVLLHGWPDWGARTAGIIAALWPDRGIGHNLPQEAPQAFAQAVIDAGHH